MQHTFRLVWQRSWEDDEQFFSKQQGTLTLQIINQIREEGVPPGMKLSQAVVILDNTYYLLGEIDVEYPTDDCKAAWNVFRKEFQLLFDKGLPGMFQIVPSKEQLPFFNMDGGSQFPIPPWIKGTYLFPV